jgi:hypothetical protein
MHLLPQVRFLLRKFKVSKIGIKVTGTLHEDLFTFITTLATNVTMVTNIQWIIWLLRLLRLETFSVVTKVTSVNYFS